MCTRNEAVPFKSAAARDAYLARHKERSARWPEPWTEQLVPTAFGQTYVRVSGREGAPPLVMLPLVDEKGTAFARLGVPDGAQFLVRPDGHVAFRCSGRTFEQLDQYLANWYPPAI